METKTYNPNDKVIEFTQTAQEHFKEAVESANALGVRLRLDGGGCAGFSYKWDLIDDLADINLTDYSQQFDGWQFWLDSTSKPYLIGSTVDKKVDLSGTVIDIFSPLASSSCGCGESVSFTI